jgi:hypothetical protein
MARKVKFGKLAIVIFLTALIWVWADLAQERDFTIPTVTIRVPESVKTLLVNFKQAESFVYAVSVDNVVLRGPAKKIDTVGRMLNRGKLELDFFLRPEEQGISEPGEQPLDVLNFLKQSKQIKDLGVTAESCEPQKLVVQVVKLVEETVAVECFDENSILQTAKSIEPPEVKAFVPADETFTAKVRLSRSEIERARASAVEKTPYIDLPGGQTREVSTKVKITMPPAEDVLPEQTIQGANLGIELSVNLLDKYQVKVNNWPDVLRTFTVRATREAKEEYERQPFQMTLYVVDSDEKNQGELKRDVVYDLPWQYVQRGEIVPPQTPAEARFELVPRSGEPP